MTQDKVTAESKEITETAQKQASKYVLLKAMPLPLHRKAMKIHERNPRSWTFSDTILDLIEKGVKSQS